MDIHDYLDSLSIDGISKYKNSKLIAKHVTFFSENTDLSKKLKYDIALLGVPDENSVDQFESAHQIRQQFFDLSPLSNSLHIIDLGNIKTGHTYNDTCFAIREVVAYTIEHNIIILLIYTRSAA